MKSAVIFCHTLLKGCEMYEHHHPIQLWVSEMDKSFQINACCGYQRSDADLSLTLTNERVGWYKNGGGAEPTAKTKNFCLVTNEMKHVSQMCCVLC